MWGHPDKISDHKETSLCQGVSDPIADRLDPGCGDLHNFCTTDLVSLGWFIPRRDMQTLQILLRNTIGYSDESAIYAKKIRDEFLPESPARLGKLKLPNGGKPDECEFFCTTVQAEDLMDGFVGGTGLTTHEAIEMVIKEVNKIHQSLQLEVPIGG